jgi:hypothetical protein
MTLTAILPVSGGSKGWLAAEVGGQGVEHGVVVDGLVAGAVDVREMEDGDHLISAH